MSQSKPGELSNQNRVGEDDSSSVEIRNNEGTAEEEQPGRMNSFLALTKTLIVRAIIVYFITSFFRRPAAPTTDPKGSPIPQISATNIFSNGTYLDMFCYLTEHDHIDFSGSIEPLWVKQNILYGDWTSGENADGSFSFSTSFKSSESLRKNGSIYLHVYMMKSGKSPDPNSGSIYAGQYYTYAKKMLNKYKRLKYMKTHNLLTGETEKSEEIIKKAETMKEEVVSHWHPNLTINIVTDQTVWVAGSVPPPLNEFIYFLPEGRQYKPPVFFNDYWNMLRDYTPINDTVDELNLELTFAPLSLFKWQIYTAQSMRDKLGWVATINGNEDDEEQDTLKELLLETSPYLLALTVIVSLLHSVFELLAFKNDIQFWNNRKSLEGLSVRSVFFNVFQSLIVLLYVLDNEANTMVRISCFIGLMIEIWKINKVVDIKVNTSDSWFPKISFTDKGSYIESSTRQYDIMAFKYLSWACFPLLISYGIYSLIYNEHKGWYSFVLNMLYGYLLTFGFIMMTPQLFINYKLKSVAHLPWRMMSYKFLNTFIDDIFAFVIKMPTMYRLGCFRDDIVFIIFLYQRWIYKVDATRVNEFGFSGEMEDELKNKQITDGTDQGNKESIEAKNKKSKKND